MIKKELLDILRCPNCVRNDTGLLKLYRGTWLVCDQCGRKYPITEGIPVMLLKEGDKWVGVNTSDLPVPPHPVN